MEGNRNKLKIASYLMIVDLLGVFAIALLIYIYLITRGLQQVKGKNKGKANMVIAILISIGGVISVFSNITKKSVSVSSIVSSGLTMALMIFYAIYANKVVDENKAQY